MLTHRTPVCAANLLFILDLCSLPFAGLVFVCVDYKVVYSMFQFFAVVLFFSLLYSLCFAIVCFFFLHLITAVHFFFSLRHNVFLKTNK